MLTEQMKAIIANNRLGFVATVDADGTPNLSPKGTCVVLDDEHIVFGESIGKGLEGSWIVQIQKNGGNGRLFQVLQQTGHVAASRRGGNSLDMNVERGAQVFQFFGQIARSVLAKMNDCQIVAPLLGQEL